MADPYATRESAAVGERPADEAPSHELVERLGGYCALDLADLRALSGRSVNGFVAAVVRDEGPLPPLARIDDPALAVVLLLRSPEGCKPANDALAALDRVEVPVYLLKQGLVAGPAGRDGAFTVTGELVERALLRALGEEVEWERDPDFGYRVVARAPGIEGADADALCPRLLYASVDRVYEHAEAVAAVKRERHRRVAAVPGIDPRLLAATGWPAEPTGLAWKD